MSSYLSQLMISNVRNLETLDLSLDANFNVFIGPNGSGKTSLLESIHLLGLGRSFRARSAQQVISFNERTCLVRGKLGDTWVAVEKGLDGHAQYRLGEASYKSVAELTKVLPIQLIDVESHLLIEGGPIYRRKFIDWGVFHVEHEYLLHWRNMQRALDQRNAALKQRRTPPEAWDEEFVKYAELIDSSRAAYIAKFAAVFLPLLQQMLNVGQVSLDYQRGWEESSCLEAQLLTCIGIDKACGHTNRGPHRADLEVLIDGKPAKQVLSRGQIKLFVCVMLLARTKLLDEPRGNVFLIDDLHAELDDKHCRLLIEAIKDFGSQVFITGIEAELLERSLQGCVSKVFHVEHGAISVPRGTTNNVPCGTRDLVERV